MFLHHYELLQICMIFYLSSYYDFLFLFFFFVIKLSSFISEIQAITFYVYLKNVDGDERKYDCISPIF